MATFTSITSANATFMLGIYGLFPVAQKLQGFSVDDIFDTEAVDTAEIQMGADGIMTAGLVYNPVPQTISLQADSVSGDIFDAWNAAQKTPPIGILYAFAYVSIPSIGKSYSMPKGVLSNYKPIPDAKKVLQPRQFKVTWESVLASPI